MRTARPGVRTRRTSARTVHDEAVRQDIALARLGSEPRQEGTMRSAERAAPTRSVSALARAPQCPAKTCRSALQRGQRQHGSCRNDHGPPARPRPHPTGIRDAAADIGIVGVVGHLDQAARDPSAGDVVHHERAADDLGKRQARHHGRRHARRRAVDGHVLHNRPGVLRDCGRIIQVAADLGGLGAARARVDVDAASVGDAGDVRRRHAGGVDAPQIESQDLRGAAAAALLRNIDGALDGQLAPVARVLRKGWDGRQAGLDELHQRRTSDSRAGHIVHNHSPPNHALERSAGAHANVAPARCASGGGCIDNVEPRVGVQRVAVVVPPGLIARGPGVDVDAAAVRRPVRLARRARRIGAHEVEEQHLRADFGASDCDAPGDGQVPLIPGIILEVRGPERHAPRGEHVCRRGAEGGGQQHGRQGARHDPAGRGCRPEN
mmetsp:Transcript_126755/g.364561  ORF Transcript_126755/g.364561 Transcript_126755/m.364561 type:complete len:436 (-) Transcript_126755:47-1354(-)